MGGIIMLVVLILIWVAWIALTISGYLHDFKPDPLIYGLISILFGVLLVAYLSEITIPTIEDYKSGNYKMRITIEMVDGKVISDTTYLKK